jgi:hypothetical protein
MTTQDTRVPVVFGSIESAGPDDALLFEGAVRPWAGAVAQFEPSTDHAAGCVCCAPRKGAGVALGWLLHARARAQVPHFRRVVVVTRSDAGRAGVEAALATDPLASVCFRHARAE